MFKTQIQQLKVTEKKIETEIEVMEEALKKQKAELRDVKQAVTSLERIQAKYEVVDEDETSSVSV